MKNEHSTIKFFNQFIRTIKKDITSVGIFTDKDGTILLDDSLRETLKRFNEKNFGVHIYIIANSGRTVQNMINSLEEQNIPANYFDYIIGDNGGMCFDVKNNKQLYKNVMGREIVKKVIEKFIELGGETANIRLADGRNIYANSSETVRNYYKKSKDIVFKDDMLDLADIDITKLTLSGTHEQISEVDKFIKENIPHYRTHLGISKFPTKVDTTYRLDFTGEYTKGSASKQLKEELGLETCIYLGNDLNDLSMFSNALEDDDFIVIANHDYNKLITDMLEKYLQEECNKKGIKWSDVKLLVLEDEYVNDFLQKISKILAVLNSGQRAQDIRSRYKVVIKNKNNEANQTKNRFDRKKRVQQKNYR